MTSKTVPKLSLIDRSGVLYLRVMIPSDVRQALGKTKVVESTKTSDRREAELRAARRHVEILEEIEAARRRLNPQPVADVTPELGKVLAERVRANLLSLDDHTRHNPTTTGALYAALAFQLNRGTPLSPVPLPPGVMPEGDRPAWAGATPGMAHATRTFHSETLALLRDAMAHGDLRPALAPAKREAEALGLVIDWNSKAQASQIAGLLKQVLGAMVLAYEDLEARNQGRVVDTPSHPTHAPIEAAQASQPKKLRDVLPKWKASKERHPDTERATERALELFEKWAKNPDLDKITSEMGADFRAHLLTLEGTSKTAKERLKAVAGLIKYAAHPLGWVRANTWADLSIKSRTTNPRRVWKPEELERFFGQPLHQQYKLPTAWRSGKAAGYWIPLLGLFTGCRITELCQLQVEDIETGDTPLIHIKEDLDAGRHLKTEAAVRSVPVHSELVRLGFLDYVRDIAMASTGPLWPDLPMRKGKAGGYFSDWFNSVRRAAPISLDKYPDFHCFRHSVRTCMTEEGISESVQDRITGHAVGGSTGAKTYSHPVKILRTAVESISYPGLSLPRVYKTTTTE
ncbi:DUF6538 domain-containing protein [Aquabacterium sp.]|uniref:DUF6538 domain-containing protein n=1 Tax=Aquabacterium sp. TaxID=1872578 RepID=UPI0035AE741B